jgi:hypothetical protein
MQGRTKELSDQTSTTARAQPQAAAASRAAAEEARDGAAGGAPGRTHPATTHDGR